METQKYLEEMKLIQNNLLSFLENDGDVSDVFQNLTTIFDQKDLHLHKHKIKSILYLISKVANNHHRNYNFFNKIGQIFQFLQHRIKHFFSNEEIFNIYRENKRILLFLFKEGILKVDENVTDIMMNEPYKTASYPYYFLPELEPFLDEKFLKDAKEKIPKNFEEKRRIGENDNYLCEIIRKDFIHEFIDQIKKTNLSLHSIVEPSIYETNNFLIKNQASLLEYAAFFGSLQIFKYIFQHIARSPKSLKKSVKNHMLLFAIHGQNPDFIRFLKESHFKIKQKNYANILNEAIKCHHNATVNYVRDNYDDQKEKPNIDIFAIALKYYNFYFIQNDFNSGSVFYHLCEYDYYPLVRVLLETKDIFSKHRPSQSRGLFISK